MNESTDYLRNRNIAVFVLMVFSVIFSGYSFTQIVSEPAGNSGWYEPIVLSCTIWIVLYIIAAWRTYKHIYLFSTAYLTALIMFHLGLFFQRYLGDFKFPSSWEHGTFSPWLENAGWHIMLALSAFGIGFSIASVTGKNYLKDIGNKRIAEIKIIGHWTSLGLLTASAIFFLFALKSYGNFLNYARHEIFSANADPRGFGVFMMIFPGSVLLYFYSAVTKKQKAFGISLALFAFLMFMFSGYRSAALFPALVGVALWVKSGRKLPLTIVIIGVSAVLMMIAASGYLRSMGKYSEMSMSDVTKAMDEASIEKSISEMGASVKALASVLQLVPSKDGYRYGSSYIHSIIDSFPNVGVSFNPEGSRSDSVKKQLSDPDAIRRMRPADWLTYRIAPWHFSRGYGVGFSAIAEPFLNFGTAGVFFIFIFIGFGLGRLDSIPLFQSPKLFLFSATMLWIVNSTVRNDSSNLFKPCVFTFLIMWIWWKFSRIFLNKNLKWRA